jgi:SAM-dependent methyltransferase
MIAKISSDIDPREFATDLHARPCPACESVSSNGMGDKGGFDWLRCLSCGTLYISTLPNAESRMHYETGGYYNDENLDVPRFVTSRLEEIVNSFAPYRQSNRFLDVGCGAGTLLSVANQAGWNAEGVELSVPTVDILRKQGLAVFPGELAQAKFPEGHFDVVTAAELIEHVPDPSSLIAEVARILRPGGIFWATTPHSHGASGRVLKLKWSVVSPPEHLHLFSVRGMAALLARHGFRQIKVKTEGLTAGELMGAFRSRAPAGDGAAILNGHQRVQSDYKLNETLLLNRRRRMIKNAANTVLRASRTGDFLKVWAER